MGILTFLDVLLGLFFVYLVFAMIASAVNEAVAALWSSRAKWLKRGLSKALGPTEFRRVLNSPHLLFLAAGGDGDGRNRYAASYLQAPDLLRALLSGRDDKQGGADLWDMSHIRDRIEQLAADSPIQVVLRDLARESKDSAAAFGKAFERWHADFDDTVRSWYRQKTHLVLLVISLALAIIFNVDSIRIVQHLSTNAESREALAAMAIEATAGDDAGELGSAKALRAARVKLDELRDQTPRSAAAMAAAEQQVEDSLAELQGEIAQKTRLLQSTGLPLGWETAVCMKADLGPCQDWRDWVLAVVFALPGILISAFAFTLGAPFWFDLLKQIANMRSVGRAPAETKKVEKASS